MCPVEFLRGETCDGYTYTAYTEHSGQVSLCGTLPLRRIHQEAERVMCIREEVELLEDGSSVRVMNVNYAGYHQDGITHYVQWQIDDPAAEKGWLYIERKKVSNLPVVTIPFPTYEAALS